jgi:putative FmdB family regulatory protein
MPWYDYDCELCGYEFTEVLPMDDRKIPVENGCPSCGEDGIRQLLGNVMIGDSINLGITKPDNTYNEVVAKINEKSGIKGTRYELEGRLENREKTKQKPLTKHEIKTEVRDKLKGKLRVGE